MRIVRMIVGMLLLTAGLPILLAAGGLWAVGQHREAGGAFRAPLEELDVPGQALIVEDLDALLRRDAAFARTGGSELRITAGTEHGPAFVGLAPAAVAADYLRAVRHTRLEHVALTRGPLPARVSTVAGPRLPVPDPSRETFWTRSGVGSLTWDADEIRDRGTALVIMTPDGTPAGTVSVTTEFTPRWLTATTWGGLGGGLLLIIAGTVMLAWPPRPRQLVYVVEPGQLPGIAARLGPRASVIRTGDDGMLLATITGRPPGRTNTADLWSEVPPAPRTPPPGPGSGPVPSPGSSPVPVSALGPVPAAVTTSAGQAGATPQASPADAAIAAEPAMTAPAEPDAQPVAGRGGPGGSVGDRGDRVVPAGQAAAGQAASAGGPASAGRAASGQVALAGGAASGIRSGAVAEVGGYPGAVVAGVVGGSGTASGAAVRAATLADATGAGGAEEPTTPIPVRATGGESSVGHESDAVLRANGWAGSPPPVTPRLTWPPLTRDPAGDTKPPIPTDATGRPRLTSLSGAPGAGSADSDSGGGAADRAGSAPRKRARAQNAAPTSTGRASATANGPAAGNRPVAVNRPAGANGPVAVNGLLAGNGPVAVNGLAAGNGPGKVNGLAAGNGPVGRRRKAAGSGSVGEPAEDVAERLHRLGGAVDG